MVATNKGHSAFLMLAGTEPTSSDELWGIGVGGVAVSKALKNDSTNLSVYMDGQAIFKVNSYSVSSTVGVVLLAPLGMRTTVGLGATVLPALREDLTLGYIAQFSMASIVNIVPIIPWFDNSAVIPELGIVMASGKTLDGQVCMQAGVRAGVAW